ncbi:MAG: glycosyltransferase family 39 protein [Candidatus Levybacteria bacterium]|nr:glycosyltransferase family 39 protein [Candidatus Levybacteria bacterium]
MLALGILIGIYSYAILVLGLFSALDKIQILIVTLPFIAALFFLVRRVNIQNIFYAIKQTSLFEKALLLLLFLLSIINIIGALGPELAFDALWYHLTIPKLFVVAKQVYFLKDSLFYYSLMPKLVEMLYVVPLFFWNEIGAKIIHFAFGLATVFATYKIARIYLTRQQSLLVAIIFYANPVVGWLSITAFSDLPRAFYECLALYFFLRFAKNRRTLTLISSAIMLGFAVCVKLLSLGTIPIFLFMIFLVPGLTIFQKIKKGTIFLLLAISIPLPWFIISFTNTGNPFYPLFTHLGLRNFTTELLSPFIFIRTFIDTLLFAPDPLVPFLFIILPIVVVKIPLLVRKYSYVLIYSIFSYLVWYFTSQSGGTRFLTAYLPAYTLLGIIALYSLKEKSHQKIIVIAIFVICVITVIYRGAANYRFVPFILGIETKQEFLMKELNFGFGDFYDENEAIKKIVGKEKVLLMNMHNLFYIDFPYTLSDSDPSWSRKYILIQDAQLPKKFQKAKEIYRNKTTRVILFEIL